MAKDVMQARSIRFGWRIRTFLDELEEKSRSDASAAVRMAVELFIQNYWALSGVFESFAEKSEGDSAALTQALMTCALGLFASEAPFVGFASQLVPTSRKKALWAWVARDCRALRFGLFPAQLGRSERGCDFGEPSLAFAEAPGKVAWVFKYRKGKCYSFGGSCE
jgi:predicted transcriptional regulator